MPLEPIRNEQEFVLFAMLIDLAPAEEGGRMSQRKPISIATDELMPDQAGAEPAAQPLADRQRRPLVRRNARGK